MPRRLLPIAAAGLALCGPACAEMVTIEWDAAGRFDKSVPVQPGKFVEACEKLPKGARVTWSFEAAAPLDFNIHFHAGQKVLYPARKDKVARDAGTLATELEQDYCWMWTNKGSTGTTLRFTLTKG
jgi:hypothetical protein